MQARPSVLFALQPLGLRTAQVESLASYVRRLAAEHVVSPTTLLRCLVLVPSPGRPRSYVDPPACTEGVNGATGTTSQILTALAALTRVDSLQRTTLIDLERVVYLRGSFRTFRAWCRVCLRSDPIAYDRLAWAVSLSRSCIVHSCELSESCANCGRSHRPWHSRATPQYCPHCGAPLTAGTSEIVQSDRFTEVIADLIRFAQHCGRLAPEAIRGGISAAVARMGGAPALGAEVGLDPESLYRLEFSGRPELSTFVKLVVASGEALVSFLSHTPRRAKRRGSWNPHRPLPLSREHFRSALEQELGKPPCERMSMAAIGRMLGVRHALLSAHFPEHVRRLTGERRAHRAAVARATRAHVLAELRGAIAQLDAEGTQPSIARVEAKTGLRGITLSPELRSALREYRSSAAGQRERASNGTGRPISHGISRVGERTVEETPT